MNARSWIAVASAEHVRLGQAQGFMQVCHGKAAPLRRLHPGDRIIYYSPERQFRSKDKLQAFTALGNIQNCAPYQVTMSDLFHPWRRNVLWQSTMETPIRPLLDQLTFTQGGKNWGYQLRFGLFPIEECDGDVIAAAMTSSGQAFKRAD